MKIKTILYWITTALVSVVFLYSAQMYIFNSEMIKGFFEQFNYTTYIVWPLAVLKILGVVMILWRKSKWLTEWAYAGFFFDLILASAAHYDAGHGTGLSVYAIPILLASYFLGNQVRTNN